MELKKEGETLGWWLGFAMQNLQLHKKRPITYFGPPKTHCHPNTLSHLRPLLSQHFGFFSVPEDTVPQAVIGKAITAYQHGDRVWRRGYCHKERKLNAGQVFLTACGVFFQLECWVSVGQGNSALQ